MWFSACAEGDAAGRRVLPLPGLPAGPGAPWGPSLRSWGSPQALGFPAARSPLSTRITPRCVGAGRLHCHVCREAAPVRAEPQGSGAPVQPCPGLGGEQGVREGAVWGLVSVWSVLTVRVAITGSRRAPGAAGPSLGLTGHTELGVGSLQVQRP